MKTHTTRALVVAICGAVLLSLHDGASPLRAQAAPVNGLKFFKNYFTTGDYAVAGVGLRGQGTGGIATGQVSLGGVPAGADILAAFLYWQIVTKDTIGPDSGATGVTFDGYQLSTPDGPIGKVLDQAGTSPCWSSGGGTGSSGGVHKTYTYRADVLRFLDVDEVTGKPIANGQHTVGIPDAGSSGNGVPIALGATLLVVYRDSSLPLRAIVLYDDGFTVDNANRTMNQTIAGFYQPAAAPDAAISYIVGSSQANKGELLTFNGAPLASNPFQSLDGESWDTRTFPVSLGANPTTVSSVTTGIDTVGISGADCLTPAAIVFRTNVLDSDGDGLLDVWEESLTPLSDPNDQPLPLLSAMGADKNRKDVFVQIDAMQAPETTYGGVAKPAHSHLPAHEALKLAGDAFWNAPERIAVHFDVGPDYPVGEASVERYILNRAYARGGWQIDEMRTVCERGNNPPWTCQFSSYPGTVGWKTGFRFIRDEIVSGVPAPANVADPCDLPGNDGPGEACERRFDRNRKDIFHYALFAHAVGLPKSGLPCLVQTEVDGVVSEVPGPDVNGACAYKENPDFRVPRTITGVGDFPGGDILVALGAFADVSNLPIGTPFMQASTLLHEFGHNFERRHGGEPSELNCKPTYLSAMNYLYQLRGLLDDLGRPHLDFSRQVINLPADLPVNEAALTDDVFGGLLPYRVGWYAPLAGSYLEGRPGVQPVRTHCDGTPLLSTDVPMVRIDARRAADAIDWSANGTFDASYPLDINFNGRTLLPSTGLPELLRGSDDWSNIKLNQIGSRRNIGGLYFDRLGRISMGALSTDVGRGDWGRGDWGRGDWGRGDWGRGDWGLGDLGLGDTGRDGTGRGDWGRGDWGRGDWGRGDWGRGDWGGGDLFRNDPDNPGGELDFETAQDLAKTPPNEFQACVVGVDCPSPTASLHDVQLAWTSANVGEVVQYNVYRVAGATLLPDPNQIWTLVGTVAAVAGQTDYAAVDSTELDDGAAYTFFAVAVYQDGVESDPSNLVTITAANDPPAAANDDYSIAEDATLTQDAPGVLVNDADPDTESALSAVLVSGPAHGTLVLNASGSFVYTPAPNFSGSDAFTYKATDGAVDSNVATVTITVTPVNDPPSSVGDSYSVLEDTPLVVQAPGVLGNDADVDSSLSAVLVTGPAHGTLVLNADGSFAYTPAANYNGPDAFTYWASDGEAAGSPATVAIAVASVNDAPVATADTYSVLQGTALVVAAPGVLTNDSDVEGPLAAVLASAPASGTLTLNANGSFVYTPLATFFGTDSFTYAASDGVASSTATVTITVQRLVYGFIGVQNLPPPSGKQFNVGSSVPLRWQFTVNGVVYNSINARPQIVIMSSAGVVVYQGDPQDPGSSSFQAPTAANGFTWQFNWQTKNLAKGTYQVYVGSMQTGQVYGAGQAFGPFAVTLK